MAPECGYVVAGMPDVEWAAWCCEDGPLLQLFGARWIPAAYDQGVLEGCLGLPLLAIEFIGPAHGRLSGREGKMSKCS